MERIWSLCGIFVELFHTVARSVAGRFELSMVKSYLFGGDDPGIPEVCVLTFPVYEHEPGRSFSGSVQQNIIIWEKEIIRGNADPVPIRSENQFNVSAAGRKLPRTQCFRSANR